MNNYKKKVISTALSLSVLATALSETGSVASAFFDGKTILPGPSTYLSSKIESTLNEINKKQQDTYFKLEAFGFLKMLQGLQNAVTLNNESFTEEEINSLSHDFFKNFSTSNASTPTVQVNRGGLLSRLVSWIIQNPFISAGLGMFGYNWITRAYRNFKTKMEAGKIERPTDPLVAMQIFDVLRTRVKGQERAMEKIKSFLLNAVDKNMQFMSSRNRKKAGPGANVLYMTGPSGVGKSLCADLADKVLSGLNAEPYTIDASDIDLQSKTSPCEQLFGMRAKKVANGDVYEYAPVIQRLKAVPNTVFIFNEIDKVWCKPIEEIVRTIKDQDYINVNGEKIDCSRATFIFTSNESSRSIREGANVVREDTVDDDGTGSRTVVHHDKSFLNRIDFVEFDNLSAEAYKEIAIPYFIQLATKYKNFYNINLDFNGTIDVLAQRVEQINQGARPIFKYLDALNTKLLNDVVSKRLQTSSSESVNYEVSFHDDEFYLNKKD